MYFVLREPFRPFTHPTWLQVSCQTLPPFTFLLPFIPTSYLSFFIKKINILPHLSPLSTLSFFCPLSIFSSSLYTFLIPLLLPSHFLTLFLLPFIFSYTLFIPLHLPGFYFRTTFISVIWHFHPIIMAEASLLHHFPLHLV